MSADDVESRRLKAALLAVAKRLRELEAAPEIARGDPGEPGATGPMPRHDWEGTRLLVETPDGGWLPGPDLRGQPGEDGDPGEPGRPGPVGPMPRHDWQGTGLRFEMAPGVFGRVVDLKGDRGDPGPTGPRPDHQWRGTRLRFLRPDGTWGLSVDLVGPPPEHRWNGTKLAFKNPDGTWGKEVDLRGPPGREGGGGGGNENLIRDILARMNPLSGYHLNDEDSAQFVKYYGYTKEDQGINDQFYILRVDMLNDPITYRYSIEGTDYATAWANRESLTYKRLNELDIP